jgi:hypothetical protein
MKLNVVFISMGEGVVNGGHADDGAWGSTGTRASTTSLGVDDLAAVPVPETAIAAASDYRGSRARDAAA